MPVRIRRRTLASVVEFFDLFGGELPTGRAEILSQLFFIPRADDDRRDRRTTQDPIERDLRDSLARFFCDRIECIDDVGEIFVINRRPDVEILLALQAALLGQRLAAANLAGQSSPTERTPDNRANFFRKR